MQFFFFLSSLAISESQRRPVILVPGLYGSNLYATYDKSVHVPWYFPKTMDDELLWIQTKLIFPPFINCVCFLSQCRLNNETNKIENKQNINITVKDFGRHTSVDYIIKNQDKYKDYDSREGKGILNFYDNFGSFIDLYVQKGYEIGKDFFITPYDWRLAPLFVDTFWSQFRGMIEKAYDISNGQKVTLTGFSMGCFMIQQFLASEKILDENKDRTIDGRKMITSIKDRGNAVSKEWIEKYIEKVVLLAPSFGGSFKAYDAILQRFSPLIPFYKTEYIGDFATSAPGFYAHWPNLEIFSDRPFVRGPDGENYTVDKLRDILFNHTNLNPEHVKIMDLSIDIQRKAPADIENVPVAIIYNSKVPTTSFLDFNNGWSNEPVRYLDEKGDGTVPSDGIRYACDHWEYDKRALVCIDVEKDDAKHFDHGALSSNPSVLEMIYKLTNGDSVENKTQWWMKTGKSDIFLESQKILRS